MVVLITLLLTLWTSPASAELAKAPWVEVIFDRGNSDQSVGLIGEEILGINDMYEWYKIHAFSVDAIVFEDQRNGERIKLPTSGSADSELKQIAVHEFIARQLKAIYKAQTLYYQERQVYADSLDLLIESNYLSDGFEDGEKKGYYFEILEVGKMKKHAMSVQNLPTFYAAASPLKEGIGNFYFSINHLEQVRYGENSFHTEWGAVWDYYENRKGIKSRYIGVE